MNSFRQNSGGFRITFKKILFGFIALVALIFLMVLATSFETVPFGHEGYLFQSYGEEKGLHAEQPYFDGKTWVAPWNGIVLIKVQEQSRDYHSEVLDKDGLNVVVDCIVNYQITRGGAAGKILDDVGAGWQEVIVDKAARGAIRDVSGKYTAEELYSTKRDQMEVEIKDKIGTRLAEYNVELVEIEISDVDLPQIIQTAIEAKMEQEQKNQRAQKKEAENIFLANATVATARGDSLAAVIEAAGQAEAYRLLKKEINGTILKDKWIDAWRAGGSQVPKYSGGDGEVILDLKDL
jgi:regulator of protease activity HflC (stomatin/prohibitin superfamily)